MDVKDLFDKDMIGIIVNVFIAIGSGATTWLASRYKYKNDEFKSIIEANTKLREEVIKQMETMKEENSEIKKESAELRKDNRLLNEKIDRLEHENRDLKNKLMEYKEIIAKYELQITDLKNKISALENAGENPTSKYSLD